MKVNSVVLDMDIAKDTLKGLEFRLGKEKFFEEGPEWTTIEVFHDGKWKDLCRTDFKDDVATGVPFPEPEEFVTDPIGYFVGKIRYGARVSDNYFRVIDRMTDG